MVTIEEIYEEAVKFVDNKFPKIESTGYKRITILKVMEMLIEIRKLNKY